MVSGQTGNGGAVDTTIMISKMDTGDAKSAACTPMCTNLRLCAALLLSAVRMFRVSLATDADDELRNFATQFQMLDFIASIQLRNFFQVNQLWKME